MAKKNTELETKKESYSERFTNMVLQNHEENAGQNIELPTFHKKLIKNYFVKLDMSLKEAETKRMAKSEQYRDSLEFDWKNVNLPKLAQDVNAFSSIGLDPLQSNHINLIPFKNSKTQKFDIVFMEGYNGIELKAKKYGLDVPDNAVIELVYSTDNFKQIKKDVNNKIESYQFEVTNEFDRGEIIGGFYYHIYTDNPEKNKLMVYSLKELEKRKPKYASVEFWGGEKDKYTNNKKDGKEKVEGWTREMLWKTVKRACWNDITIDSSKIDNAYKKALEIDRDNKSLLVSNEVSENANKDVIDIDAEEVND